MARDDGIPGTRTRDRHPIHDEVTVHAIVARRHVESHVPRASYLNRLEESFPRASLSMRVRTKVERRHRILRPRLRRRHGNSFDKVDSYRTLVTAG